MIVERYPDLCFSLIEYSVKLYIKASMNPFFFSIFHKDHNMSIVLNGRIYNYYFKIFDYVRNLIFQMELDLFKLSKTTDLNNNDECHSKLKAKAKWIIEEQISYARIHQVLLGSFSSDMIHDAKLFKCIKSNNSECKKLNSFLKKSTSQLIETARIYT